MNILQKCIEKLEEELLFSEDKWILEELSMQKLRNFRKFANLQVWIDIILLVNKSKP